MFTISTAVSVFLLAVLTNLVKKYISPKFGSLGVHVFIFSIAVLVSIVYGLATYMPSFGAIVETGLMYLTMAVATYEVLLKRLGM